MRSLKAVVKNVLNLSSLSIIDNDPNLVGVDEAQKLLEGVNGVESSELNRSLRQSQQKRIICKHT